MDIPIKSRFSIYGPVVALSNGCGELDECIQLFLGPFALKRNLPGGRETCGEIRRFEMGEVTRSLSAAGESERRCDSLVSIYSSGERHWILDDRWGVCEIDLLKHRWRSWVLPHATLDPVELAEAAVLQPMAQLLRLRGVEPVPAISIERGGWAALVIAPYAITAEISRAIRAGYRVIGQRWTVLLRKSDRIVLKHFPGMMESRIAGGKSIGRRAEWVDVTANNPWAAAETAWCDAVVAIAAGRRSRSSGRIVAKHEAQALLRHAWPISALSADRAPLRHSASILAGRCICMAAQLSRHDEQFVDLLEMLRKRSDSKPQVSIYSALRQGRMARGQVA